jgi:hypothetical protein
MCKLAEQLCCRLDNLKVGVSFLEGKKIFLHRVCTGSGAYTAFHPVDIGSTVVEGKAAGL